MASSSNRFAVLGGTPSSSKGQKEKIPVTGNGDKEDQPMQDTAQTSPILPLSGLEDSLPKMQSKQELIALFRKRRQEFFEREEANAREKERMKKSQGRRKPTTFVGSLTPSAGLISQGPRKRTASSDEAEKPSKRQHMGSRSPSQAVGEPASATPMTVSASETEEPEEPDVMREEAPIPAIVVQEDPFLSPPSSFEWHDIRMPKKPLLCIVQANNSTRIGSFAENNEGWAFTLMFNADRWQVPTMTMRFFSDGIKARASAQTGWCLGEWMKDDWMVTDFKVYRVADCAENGKIRHRDILAACKTDEEKARLTCISLEAWPKILGHFDRNNRWKNPQPGVKNLFSAVLTGRHAYHLRIWFLAPGDFETMEKQSLSIFNLFFHRRKPTYDGIRDANGVGFDL